MGSCNVYWLPDVGLFGFDVMVFLLAWTCLCYLFGFVVLLLSVGF